MTLNGKRDFSEVNHSYSDLQLQRFLNLFIYFQAENGVNGEAQQGLCWTVKVLDASKDGEIVKFTIQTNTVSAQSSATVQAFQVRASASYLNMFKIGVQ